MVGPADVEKDNQQRGDSAQPVKRDKSAARPRGCSDWRDVLVRVGAIGDRDDGMTSRRGRRNHSVRSLPRPHRGTILCGRGIPSDILAILRVRRRDCLRPWAAAVTRFDCKGCRGEPKQRIARLTVLELAGLPWFKS
jgi:hypothetical protein